MKINTKFGSEIHDISIPGNATILTTGEPEFNITRDAFINGFLETAQPLMHNLARVAVIISDKTRLCGYEIYLPWLLEALENSGASKDNITFFIAYGTHPRQSEEECFASYGDTYKKYRFIHHDCKDEKLFIDKGSTSRGTPIKLRKDILEATFVVTFGAISHHYFAGFGGGRKLFFPGLGERKAIYHNHSLFLNFVTRQLNVTCKPGGLDHNPLAEDLKEMDAHFPARVSVHGILDSNGKVTRIRFGTDYSDFEEACREHDSFYKSAKNEVYDTVIASAGGYPKDINFIQSHKSIHNSAAFVKDGGTLIVFAECRDGMGNEGLLPLFKLGGMEPLFKKLEEKYEGNGGTALAMMSKAKRINIFLVTQLDQETCTALGVKKIGAEEVAAILNEPGGSCAFIPNASMLIPQ